MSLLFMIESKGSRLICSNCSRHLRAHTVCVGKGLLAPVVWLGYWQLSMLTRQKCGLSRLPKPLKKWGTSASGLADGLEDVDNVACPFYRDNWRLANYFNRSFMTSVNYVKVSCCAVAVGHNKPYQYHVTMVFLDALTVVRESSHGSTSSVWKLRLAD